MSTAMPPNPAEPASASGGRLRRAFLGRLVAVMNSMGTCWIFVLLVLINLDIIGRTLFDSPVAGVNEIVGMSIVACVFLQLGHTLRKGRLTRSDIILSRLQGHPRLVLVLDAVYNLVGAGLLIVLLVYSYPLFTHAWSIGEYEGSAGGFTAPVWPVKLIIVIGCLAGAFQCLINCRGLVQKAMGLIKPGAGEAE
jgi:TRAP-type mannitol/chloroaromatic compound transport system permease small subunit